MSLPGEPAAESEGAEYDELAELVRGAAAGLDERDQLVLEFSVRQGLDGNDLADALGVTPQQCYGLVHRMRQRTERSLGAFCVARTGRDNCDELARILSGWDGQFSVLIRKRVARHVEGCDTCEQARRTIAPFAMFGSAPAFVAPPELRRRVLDAARSGGTAAYGFAAPGGFPTVIKYARRIAAWLVLTVLALLIAGAATVFVLVHDDEPDVAVAATTTTIGAATTTTGVTTTTSSPSTTVPGVAPSTGPPATTGSVTTTTPTGTSSTSTTIAPARTTIAATAPVTPPVTATTTTTTSTSTTTTVAPTTTTTSTTTTTTSTTTTSTTTTSSTTTTTTVPGMLVLSSGSIDFGTSSSSAVVTLSNTGGQPVGWSTSSGPAAFRGTTSPFSASPSSGTLAGGASVEVTIGYDRNWPIEGPSTSTDLTFIGAGTFATVTIDGTIARPPEIVPINVPPATACPDIQQLPPPFAITADITDETDPINAVFSLTDPLGATTDQNTQVKSPTHSASIFPPDPDGDGVMELGTWTWELTATDGFGNVATLGGTTDVQAIPCP